MRLVPVSAGCDRVRRLGGFSFANGFIFCPLRVQDCFPVVRGLTTIL